MVGLSTVVGLIIERSDFITPARRNITCDLRCVLT